MVASNKWLEVRRDSRCSLGTFFARTSEFENRRTSSRLRFEVLFSRRMNAIADEAEVPWSKVFASGASIYHRGVGDISRLTREIRGYTTGLPENN